MGKFRLFNLAEILINLFPLFLILLFLFLLIPTFSTISINASKYFANFIKVFLSIKVNNLAILLKF